MALMCHVEASSKGSRVQKQQCTGSMVCVVLTSFTCKDRCPSMILGTGAVGRLLLLTAFLEARFF